MALNVCNKLGFIDGTILKPPADHRDSGSWSRCNDMVSTCLLFMSTAESIWKNLMTRFKQDDAPRIFEIEQRLSTIQQGSLDISTYYMELVTLWEEYQNYVDLPVCTCDKCECHAASSWEQLQQRSRVMKLLMGLNESYETTRRHILMIKPIPPIEEVFNLVTQDERQKNIKPSTWVDNIVFQNSTSELDQSTYSGPVENAAYAAVNNNNYRSRPRPICTHCGIAGHIVQKCFKLHGYPPGHRLYNSNSQRSNTQSGSSQRSSQSRPTQSLSQQNNVANVATASSVASLAGTLNLSAFHPDQVHQLIQQLQSHLRLPEPVTSQSFVNASITYNSFMAAQSSSDTNSLLA
ncbi:hypothetical protein Bca52824_056448 [Brassica carinata]|uniref:CCHC-type domain-containing protein n=1 Tax=Brassica carinata TaxID=52824 RepID=A0A8X7QP70_BRACI|nr:hypothetical protein Bca52824_056448 [Brassica carinata]